MEKISDFNVEYNVSSNNNQSLPVIGNSATNLPRNESSVNFFSTSHQGEIKVDSQITQGNSTADPNLISTKGFMIGQDILTFANPYTPSNQKPNELTFTYSEEFLTPFERTQASIRTHLDEIQTLNDNSYDPLEELSNLLVDVPGDIIERNLPED